MCIHMFRGVSGAGSRVSTLLLISLLIVVLSACSTTPVPDVTTTTTAEEPIEKPVAEEPAGQEPVAEEPTTEKPVSEDGEPSTEKPATEEPLTEEATDKDKAPSTEKPSTDEPSTEEPVIEEATLPQTSQGFPAAVWSGADVTASITTYKPEGAKTAFLTLSVQDPDVANEAELYINNNGPFILFGELASQDYDGKTVDITLEIPANWWVSGVNNLRFKHLETVGFEVKAAMVVFDETRPVESAETPGSSEAETPQSGTTQPIPSMNYRVNTNISGLPAFQSGALKALSSNYRDFSSFGETTLNHPSTGAIDPTGHYLMAGAANRIYDRFTGTQVGQLATGGGARNQAWHPTKRDTIIYGHRDGSIREQRIGGGETIILRPSDIGYSDLAPSYSEGNFITDDGRLLMLVGAKAGRADLLIYDLQAQKMLPNTQPLNGFGNSAHDLLLLGNMGRVVFVKSVPNGTSEGSWWIYRITEKGLEPRILSQTKRQEHAATATESVNGVVQDRLVTASGDVIDEQGKVVRTLRGFSSLGQHVQGLSVFGHDSVVVSNGSRASLLMVDGSGGWDLGPTNGGESYAQVVLNVAQPGLVFQNRMTHRTYSGYDGVVVLNKFEVSALLASNASPSSLN